MLISCRSSASAQMLRSRERCFSITRRQPSLTSMQACWVITIDASLGAVASSALRLSSYYKQPRSHAQQRWYFVMRKQRVMGIHHGKAAQPLFLPLLQFRDKSAELYRLWDSVARHSIQALV